MYAHVRCMREPAGICHRTNSLFVDKFLHVIKFLAHCKINMFLIFTLSFLVVRNLFSVTEFLSHCKTSFMLKNFSCAGNFLLCWKKTQLCSKIALMLCNCLPTVTKYSLQIFKCRVTFIACDGAVSYTY